MCDGIYGGHLWHILAVLGLFLNLFNLIPVSPLDGGRVAAAISRWLWPVGLGILALYMLYNLAVLHHLSAILVLVLVLGGRETVQRFRGTYKGTVGQPGYAHVEPRQHLVMTVLYVGLVVLLSVTLLRL